MIWELRSAFDSKRSQTIGFFAVVLAVSWVRYVVFVSGGAPATIDAGNWIAYGDALLGNGVRSESLAYPPVVPIIATIAVRLLGLTAGVAVVGAAAAAAPAIGFFFALGRLGISRLRLIPSLLLLGVGSVGEVASWGGFPQLIATAMVAPALVALTEMLREHDRRSALRLAAFVFATFATSHFVAALLVVSLAALVVVWCLEQRSLKSVGVAVRWLPVVVAPSVVLVPIYLRLFDAVIVHPNEFADLDNLALGNALARLETVYGDATMLWRVLLALTIVSVCMRWRPDDREVVKLVRASLLAVFVMLVATQESRYFYLLPVPVMFAVTQWASEATRRVAELDVAQRRLAMGAAVLLVAGQYWAGVSTLDNHRYFYAVLTPDLVEGFDRASEAAAEGEVIAIPSLEGAPLGWWLEAVSGRDVVYGSALRWLNYSDEVERATAANAVFRPDFPASDSLSLLRDADVSIVVLPRTWRWFDLDRVTDWAADSSIDVVSLNADTMVLRLG